MTADIDPEAEELLSTIEPTQCVHLLEAVQFGRLATVDGGRPVLVVLNHLVQGGELYFRTREDAQLARLTEGGQVVPAIYEVDSAFPVGASGWSVMATGLLELEDDESRARQLRSKPPAWARGERDVVLHLEVRELSGRRVGRL